MAYKRKEIDNIEGLLKDGKKKFVRYDEGAAMYSMGQHTFEQFAKEAYLIGQRKLFAGEEHHFGIKVLNTEEGEIYSVTVCAAWDDEYYCEAIL